MMSLRRWARVRGLIETLAVRGFGDKSDLETAGLEEGGAGRDRFHRDDSMG
jgi:hypothetical protein